MKKLSGAYQNYWRETLSTSDIHHKSLVSGIPLCTRSISNVVSGFGLFSFQYHFQCQCLVLFSPSRAEMMENVGIKSHFTKQECLIVWNVCVCSLVYNYSDSYNSSTAFSLFILLFLIITVCRCC